MTIMLLWNHLKKIKIGTYNINILLCFMKKKQLLHDFKVYG